MPVAKAAGDLPDPELTAMTEAEFASMRKEEGARVVQRDGQSWAVSYSLRGRVLAIRKALGTRAIVQNAYRCLASAAAAQGVVGTAKRCFGTLLGQVRLNLLDEGCLGRLQ